MLKKIKTAFWTKLAKIKCGHTGKHLKVNSYSKFTRTTYIEDFCNFNGMKIQGHGKVQIGKYFHSGMDCLIITENHNYEGEKMKLIL